MDMSELQEAMRQLQELGLGRETMLSDPTLNLLLRRMEAQEKPPQKYSAKLLPAVVNRQGYVEGYNETMKHRKALAEGNSSVHHTTAKAAIEHGVAPELSTLRPITLKGVAKCVNFIHEDAVLFCKTIHSGYTRVGAIVLVEDDQDDCISLSLYNFLLPGQNIGELLPTGTRLALLAPYMKNMQDDKTAPLMLRCDNPQCVIRFDTDAAWQAAKSGKAASNEKMEPAELKTLGNEAFRGNKLDTASRCYTRALASESITLDDKIACLSNRAQVSLRSEQWEQAENDTRKVLTLDSSHVKAKYRLARSLLRLGKVDAALQIAKELLVDDATNGEFGTLLHESQRLLKEQTGQYDFEQMRREQIANNPTFHADFDTTKVSFGTDIMLPGGGMYRGCKAIHDLRENELICAHKSLIFVGATNEGKTSATQVDMYGRQVSNAEHLQACAKTVALLCNRPALGRKLYELSAGSTFTAMAGEHMDKVDIPRIRAIISCNAFATSDENIGARFLWVKWKKIQELGRPLNSLDVFELNQEFGSGIGLWVNESMFNHSCVPNCTCSLIGDHMFVRSARSIAVGEELCISYTDHDKSYDERVCTFATWISQGEGFTCQCPWCCAMRKDVNLCKITKAVDAAYKKAAMLVTTKQMQMWRAAESVLPLKKRQDLLSKFRQSPLHIQHNAGAKLRVLHGSCLCHAGDLTGALAMYEEAGAIGYAVRGNGGIDRAQDLWRIVGAALRCKDKSKACGALKNIWERPDFSAFSSPGEARQAFADLTLCYAAPWYDDRQLSPHEYRMITQLVHDVCDGKTKQASACSKTAGSSKKKGRRKK